MPAEPSLSAISPAGTPAGAAELRVLPVCGRARRVWPGRLAAAGLLAVVALRFWVVLVRKVPSSASVVWIAIPGLLAVLALGACLWWVAKRQFSVGGACVALALCAASPIGSPAAGTAGLVSLGLFAMLYTSVGVAHALQGPRIKWKPRILLMAALCGFTAMIQPLACVAALLLALGAMLYLAEHRRRLLPALFGGWAAAAIVGSLLRFLLERSAAAVLLTSPADSVQLSWLANIGILVAISMALVLWVMSQRSRYFGNTGPLLVACCLALASIFAGQRVLLWALPFALLFVAGIAADAFEGEYAGAWKVLAGLVCLLQLLTVVVSAG